jgi:acetylornithine deacetylase/succinyl-diaminopimelate desuccinylase-like protein
VVPVEAEHWPHSPFSSDLADGCAWGRGTRDMESMVVMELMTMLLLVQVLYEVVGDFCSAI